MDISEKELEDYLVEHLDEIAPPGIELGYVERQHREWGGNVVDIFGIYAQGGWGKDDMNDGPGSGGECFIELKVRELDDAAVGQIIRYAGGAKMGRMLQDERIGHSCGEYIPLMILVGSSCPPAIAAGCASMGIVVWTYKLALGGITFECVTTAPYTSIRQYLGPYLDEEYPPEDYPPEDKLGGKDE